MKIFYSEGPDYSDDTPTPGHYIWTGDDIFGPFATKTDAQDEALVLERIAASEWRKETRHNRSLYAGSEKV
jgi:hypothetical protein